MIVRVNKNSNYTVMSNIHLKDRNLTLKAKGLLSVILSLPDDWDYSVKGLASISKEKESAIESTLKELKENGYLIITKKMPDETRSGRIEYEWDFYEMPQTEKQELKKQGVENQGLEIQGLENRPQLNTNILNIKELNTKEDIKKERTKEKSNFDDILNQIPIISDNPELRECFIEFIKMRKLIKAPLTDRALKMIINEAYKLSCGEPMQMQKIVEQSIRNNWKDVYPIKENKHYSSNTKSGNPFTELKRKEGML